MTKIFGVDPGTGRTGWGIIQKDDQPSTKYKLKYVAHGCIVTTNKSLMPERLMLLYSTLNYLLEKHIPDCLIIENIFFGRNVKTAISVSQARGVIMLSAAKFNLPIYEYTPSTVKLSLTGSGKAEKSEVQDKVRKMLNKNSKNLKLAFNGKKDKDFDDSADALAIAIHHAIKENIDIIVKVNKIKK